MSNVTLNVYCVSGVEVFASLPPQGVLYFYAALPANWPGAYQYIPNVVIDTPVDHAAGVFADVQDAINYHAPLAAVSLTAMYNGIPYYSSTLNVTFVAGTLVPQSSPVSITHTFTNPTRTLNTAFQISATQDASVVYSLPIQCAATLIAGAKGALSFQYADNSAMTTNVKTLPGDEFGVGSGLVVTANGTLKVSGGIPAGKWVKLVTTNVLGTPTYGSLTSQEVLG